MLTFANPVFDSANKEQVGTDNGSCFRTAAGKAWECIWTVSLDEGQITVEGSFYDGKDSTLAITGGSDEFEEASGQMVLHAPPRRKPNTTSPTKLRSRRGQPLTPRTGRERPPRLGRGS